MAEEPLVRVETRFAARPEGLAELHSAFDRFFADPRIESSGMGATDRVAIRTAAGEIAANIIAHACRDLPGAEMSLVVDGHPDRIEVAFEDPGLPFEDLEALDPHPVADPTQGGFGLRVVRASVDTLEYVRAGAVNRWRLVRMKRNAPRENREQEP